MVLWFASNMTLRKLALFRTQVEIYERETLLEPTD
jgi:hypothetical protein